MVTFWSKVRENPESGCWEWQAAVNQSGYGRFMVGSPRKQLQAHRLAYELMVGEIPPGLDLDHLCRVRHCVNPWHLEPVPRSVNVARGDAARVARERCMLITHCPQGHVYDEANTYLSPVGGYRQCRRCRSERDRLAKAARSALRLVSTGGAL